MVLSSGEREGKRRVPETVCFPTGRNDLPGLLVSATDCTCAVLGVTIGTEILSPAVPVPDANKAVTGIFESPLTTW
jgi:hypothetical protein